MSTTNFLVTLTQDTCKKCGGLFAISQDYINEARRLGGFKQMWACPYCKTTWGYGEGEVDGLKKEITALTNQKQWLEKRKAEIQAEAEHFRKSRDITRGLLHSVKQRVKNGVCPCCKRTFCNLQRHMKTQHPGFAPTEEINPK